jgi:hypothetical protein
MIPTGAIRDGKPVTKSKLELAIALVMSPPT